jgi:hypothetical protein
VRLPRIGYALVDGKVQFPAGLSGRERWEVSAHDRATPEELTNGTYSADHEVVPVLRQKFGLEGSVK